MITALRFLYSVTLRHYGRYEKAVNIRRFSCLRCDMVKRNEELLAMRWFNELPKSFSSSASNDDEIDFETNLTSFCHVHELASLMVRS